MAGWRGLGAAVLALALSGCASGGHPQAAPGPVDPRRASGPPTPALDGQIDSGEWAGARVEAFGGEGRLRVRIQEQTLWVSVESGADGIASLLLASGDRVWVLHASAALATARYQRSGATWQRTQDFEWAGRDPQDPVARQAFLLDQGWLANVAPGGGADREFQIDLRRFGGEVRLVAGYLHTQKAPGKLELWPAGVADHGANLELHQGAAPAEARFAPETWAPLAGATAP